MGTGIQAIIRLRCCCKRSEESPAAFKNDLPYNYGTGTTNTGRVLSRTDAIQPEHSVNYSLHLSPQPSRCAGRPRPGLRLPAPGHFFEDGSNPFAPIR